MIEETPRYRLEAKSSFHDRLYEPGEEVETNLRPGPHMTPLNDAAKAAFEKARASHVIDPLSPLMRLNNHGEPMSGLSLKAEHFVALEALAKLLKLVPMSAGDDPKVLAEQAEALKPADKPLGVPAGKRAQGDGQGPDSP